VSENIQKDLEKKEKMQKHREAVLNEVKNFNKELVCRISLQQMQDKK